MQFFRQHAKPICHFLSICLFAAVCYSPVTQAGVINTETLLNADINRDKVETFLQRQDVQTQLIANGVDPALALTRTEYMTDAEIQLLADQIDEQVAAGGAFGTIVFVFLVLLVTDILGYTDIFPFVKKTAK